MAQLLVRRTALALLAVTVFLYCGTMAAHAAGHAKSRGGKSATAESGGMISVAGLVTDRRRESVPGAKVELFAGTQVVGTATTDAGGAFTIVVATAPDSIRVSAKDYTAVKVNVLNPTGIIVVLKPKGSSSRKGHAESDDLPILPYNDLGYAQSLRTFTTIRGGQFIRIADRGLGGNVIGAAGKNFADVPARYASYVSPIDANQAYRTNANGATGLYLVGADSPEPAGGEFELGSLKTVDLQATVFGLDVVAGDSRGDGTTRSRSDVTYRGPLAGGALWATGYYASATQDSRALGNTISYGKINYQHALGEMTATFETTLRQKITYNGSSGIRLITPSSTYSNQLRLKDAAGAISWEVGAITSRQYTSQNLQLPTNSANLEANSEAGDELIDSGGDSAAVPFGTLVENRVYAEGRYAGSRTDVSAGLGAADLSLSGTDGRAPADKERAGAIQPSVQITQRVGSRLSFVGGQSSGIETPRISRRYFTTSTPPPTFLTRTYVTEVAARYEAGDSLNAEIQEYKEIRNTPLYSTILVGTGYSADWRISRIFHLRAWTLAMHTAYFNASARTPPVATPGRDVAFLTYTPSERMRADVIYRRETDPMEQGRFIDWDALYKFDLRTAITASYEHHRTYSTFGTGLRITTP